MLYISTLIYFLFAGNAKKQYQNDNKDNVIVTNIIANRSKKCIDFVFAILESSPPYKKLTKGLNNAIIKNGGTGFALRVHASPNPKIDNAENHSDKYEISIYENYADRQPKLASFTFDPKTKLLYEENIEGELNLIAFDKKLLIQFSKACK